MAVKLQPEGMPEGPSIVILKEDVKEFKKQKIVSASGSSKLDYDRLQGAVIADFKTWGKHFLICFPDFTIRIHLLMFGTYRINDTKDLKPRLSLHFAKGELNFYTCAIKELEGKADEFYDWTGDIMNKKWDPAKAKEKLKAKPEMLVCDALLDQDIFAGSGNIIKNEVLYRVKVHPQSAVGKLPARKLNEMIKETSAYSFDFLGWKKEGTLKKHWLAHTKKECKRCDLPLHKEYLGKNKRRAFFCENCQALYK